MQTGSTLSSRMATYPIFQNLLQALFICLAIKDLLIVVTQRVIMDILKNVYGVCKTRWSKQDISYKGFYLAMRHIIEVLEIMNGTHFHMTLFVHTCTKGWSSKDKQDVFAYLHAFWKFQCITSIHYTGSFIQLMKLT